MSNGRLTVPPSNGNGHPPGPPTPPPTPPPGPPVDGNGPDEPDDGDRGDGDDRRATRSPSLDRLSRTLQRGAAISAFVLVVTQFMSFVQTLVVGRLLSPTEVGIFTGGAILVNFLTEFSEGGLKNALIQRQENPDNPQDLDDVADTVFYVTFIVGVLMAAVSWVAAPIVGWISQDPAITPVVAASSGVLILNSLQNVPDGLMQRQFNFKRRLYVDPSKAASFAIAAIVFSALGFGVWGLVAALYLSMVLTTVLLWTFAGYRPGRGRASYRLWRELARFAGPLVVQGVGLKIREFSEQALVLRFLGVAPAGQYRYGRRIGTLPGTAILQVASYVLFPAFSRISSDIQRMRRGFLRATTVLWIVSAPAGALLVAVGEPMIVVLLGEKWRGAGIAVMGMAGYGPGMALTAVGTEALKGAGASKRLHWVTGTAAVVGLGGLVCLLPLGLFGVGLAVSLEMLVSGAMCLFLALRYADVSQREAVRLLVPPVVASLAAGVATWFLEHEVLRSDARPIAGGVLLLVLDGLAFCTVFYLVLRLIAPSAAGELDAVAARVRRMLTKRRAAAKPPEDEEPLGIDEAVAAVRASDPRELPEELTRAMWAFDDPPTQQLWALDDVTRPLYIPMHRLPPRYVPLRVVQRTRGPRRR